MVIVYHCFGVINYYLLRVNIFCFNCRNNKILRQFYIGKSRVSWRKSLMQLVTWSSAKRSAFKMLASGCWSARHYVVTLCKHTLNNISDNEHSCRTPCFIKIIFRLHLSSFLVIKFISTQRLWIAHMRCFGSPFGVSTCRNLFLLSYRKFYIYLTRSISRKVKFFPVSAIWADVNTQSMHERPFLKPFCSLFIIVSAV
jgi:hypothetical protein